MKALRQPTGLCGVPEPDRGGGNDQEATQRSAGLQQPDDQDHHSRGVEEPEEDQRMTILRSRATSVLLDDLDQSDDLVARDPVGELRMVAAEMVQREVDDLILGVAAHDLAALACDLPGHGSVSRTMVGLRP